MFKKGDIIKPVTRVEKVDWLSGLYHAAVVWDDEYSGIGDFHGIILTHSGPTKRFHNILMLPDHFIVDLPYAWDNTHFVNQIFIKMAEWGPFEKVGQLSDLGKSFILQNIAQGRPIMFEQYYRGIRS
jgi:hypothetical protein